MFFNRPFRSMIKTWISNLFTAGASPSRLDGFRVIFPLFALIIFWRLPWELYADIPLCIWNPPGTAKHLFRGALSLSQIGVLRLVFLSSMIMLSVGFLSRMAALIAAISLYVIMGNALSAYYYDRSGNQLLLVLFILFLSPTLGTHFSIDRYLFKRQPQALVESVWPIRLIQFLFFFTFFAAGASKLINSGLSWADSENIIAKWIWAGETFRTNIFFDLQNTTHSFMVQQRGWAAMAGPLVLILETGSLLFFIFNRWMTVGAIALGALQLGVFFIMFISFNLFIPMYLVFVPAEKIFARLGQIKTLNFAKRKLRIAE